MASDTGPPRAHGVTASGSHETGPENRWSSEALARLREICLALPEATEKPFGGHTAPAFRVRDKMFASCMEYAPAISLKAPPGAQEVLVSADPERFFVPRYVGPK